MLGPGPQSAVLNKNKKKQEKKNNNNKKHQQGSGVDVHWSLATPEMKAPKDGAGTISGGRVFQSLIVLGKNELRR